jgi:penicillin-binding protein-related factor A (putative recombinase)
MAQAGVATGLFKLQTQNLNPRQVLHFPTLTSHIGISFIFLFFSSAGI